MDTLHIKRVEQSDDLPCDETEVTGVADDDDDDDLVTYLIVTNNPKGDLTVYNFDKVHGLSLIHI